MLFGWMERCDKAKARRVKRKVVAYATAVGIAALITACGGQNSSSGTGGNNSQNETGSAATSLTHVTLQDSWTGNYQSAGYFVAIDQGFYKREGLDVEVLPGGPDVNAIQVVAAGRALIGVSDPYSVISARDKGVPLKAIGARYQIAPNVILCRNDAGVATPKDLIGKRLASPPKDLPIVEAALKVAGIDPTMLKLTSTGADLGPFLHGEFDCRHGYFSNEPVLAEMQGQKVTVLRLYDLGYKQQGGVLFVTDQTLQKDRELLRRFMKATVEGWQWAIDHPEDAIRSVVKRHPDLKYDQQLRQLREDEKLMLTNFSQQNGLFAVDPSIWDTTIRLMNENHLITKNMPVNTLIDTSLVPKAGQ